MSESQIYKKIHNFANMNCTKKDWFFIVNPHAGSGKTMSKWIPAEKKLARLGIRYCTAYTDYRRHATALAEEAAENGFRRICAVGGDGSIHEVFCGLAGWCEKNGVDPREFVIGVVPIGSGNDWIKSVRVDNDVEKVIDLIAEESFGEMDVVEMTGEGGKTCHMANIGGVGFDSHVCQRVNMQKEIGMRSKRIYLTALYYTIRHLGAINVRVVADGKEVFCGPCYSIALGNGRYSGGMMQQVPLADINDGILDAMIVPRVSILQMLPEIPKLMSGTIHKSRKIISLKCRELQIVPLDGESADIFESDGEIEGRLPLTVRMTGRKIGILTGEPSTKGL